jgi:hypothetical protein
MQELETRIKNKDELLAGRDAEINELRSQLSVLTKGIGQMSSFFRQAEALATIEGQDASTPVPNETLNGREAKPGKAVPSVPDAPREIVSPHLLNRITDELTEVTGVMGPIASIIVRDHVLALGETMERFPKARLLDLLESLSKEILDENLKSDFRQRLAHTTQIFGSDDSLLPS